MNSIPKETVNNLDSPELSNEYDTPNSPIFLDEPSFPSNEERLQHENEMLRTQISKLWGIINKQRAVIKTLQSKVPRRGSSAGLIGKVSEDDPVSNDSEASGSHSLVRQDLSPQSASLYIQATKQIYKSGSIEKNHISTNSLNTIQENKQIDTLGDSQTTAAKVSEQSSNTQPVKEKEPIGLGLVNSNEDVKSSNLKKAKPIPGKIKIASSNSELRQTLTQLERGLRPRNASLSENTNRVNTKTMSLSQPSSTTMASIGLESPPPSPGRRFRKSVIPGFLSAAGSKSPGFSPLSSQSKQTKRNSKELNNFNTSPSINKINNTDPSHRLDTVNNTHLSVENRRVNDSIQQSDGATSDTAKTDLNDSNSFTTARGTPVLSDEGLPTPPLKELHSIAVEVSGSAVRRNSKGKETLVFKLQVKQLPPSTRHLSILESETMETPGTPLWLIEKHFSDFLALDNKIKQIKSVSLDKDSKLPEKKHWSSISPSKMDQRKFLLQQYLMKLIFQSSVNPECIEPICKFLSSDLAEETQPTPRTDGKMEGYLIKRGKNFGKWKRRYFVLSTGVLNYYEIQNGSLLGSIKLDQVQVAVQQTSNIERTSEENVVDTFRHAFMILEPKRNSSFNRHVLCADSDAERDLWVAALSVHLNTELNIPNPYSSIIDQSPSNSIHRSALTPDIEASSPTKLEPNVPHITNQMEKDAVESEILSSSPPTTVESIDSKQHNAKSFTTTSPTESQANLSNASSSEKIRPKSSKDQLTSKFLGLNKEKLTLPNPQPVPQETNKKPTKKNFFWNKRLFGNEGRNKSTPLPIFGVNLQQSVATSSVGGYPLPSIVFRCIQYLDSKNAECEEGIYRLSGSTATIDNLRNKFEIEGDYDILNSNVQYDIHAVTGLLKMFLRNLPFTVLTSELQPDFLRVTDLLSRKDRVRELGKLVCSLPIENYALLRALVSHLLTIVEKSDVNKMTLKNIGIVFAPTLGIPAGVFALFMSEFSYIFYVDGTGSAAPRELTDDEDEEPDSFSTTTGSKSIQNTSSLAGDNSQFEEELTQASIDSTALGSRMVNLKGRSHRRVKSEDLIKVSTQEIFQTDQPSQTPETNIQSDKPSLMQILESPPGRPISVSSSRQSSRNSTRMLSKSSSHMNIKLASPSSPSGSAKRNRSNRNSLLYQFTAPREVVEKERRLSVTLHSQEEFLEEFTLNVSTVSETSVTNELTNHH